ncbi:MAG: hypothetical protein R3B66_11875 [Candidatus Scalinduaceae bacterium]
MKKMFVLSLIATLSLFCLTAAVNVADAGEAQVIATIQTGPEWEPARER